VSATTPGTESRGTCDRRYETSRLPFARDARSLRRRVLDELPLTGLVVGYVLLIWWTRRSAMESELFLAAAVGGRPATECAGAVAAGLRIPRGRRRRPNEPWTWDEPWDPAGRSLLVARARDGRKRVFVGLWLLAGAVSSWIQSGVRIETEIFGAVFGLVGTWFCWRGFQNLRAGQVRLATVGFPLFVGERIELSFGVSDGGAKFHRGSVLLRCLEQCPGRKPTVFHVWSEWFDLDRDTLPGPGNDTLLRFDVPAGLRGTRLDVPDACCWELRVMGTTDRGPVSEMFLVPIYERPAA
jgi:hypothetical protein